MSRLYETLRRIELQRRRSTPDGAVVLQPVEVVNNAMLLPVEVVNNPVLQPVEVVNSAMVQPAEIDGVSVAEVAISPAARLVALTDSHGLGAEKFRALATRLDHQRSDNGLRSLQVTSVV